MIIQYTKSILKITIFLLTPFVTMTLFTSYFLFGDFTIPDFKKIAFLSLRILGSIFRGTIENEDFEDSIKSDFQK
jgi:hypothetical protein